MDGRISKGEEREDGVGSTLIDNTQLRMIPVAQPSSTALPHFGFASMTRASRMRTMLFHSIDDKMEEHVQHFKPFILLLPSP